MNNPTLRVPRGRAGLALALLDRAVMHSAERHAPLAIPQPTLEVRVVGPESPVPGLADLRHLFAGRALPRARRDRITGATRVLVLDRARVIGLAAYERTDHELRVFEMAVEPSLAFGLHDIVRQLLDAIDLACIAGGCRRIVLLPAAVLATAPFERLGYGVVADGCAGGWLEKTFL